MCSFRGRHYSLVVNTGRDNKHKSTKSLPRGVFGSISVSVSCDCRKVSQSAREGSKPRCGVTGCKWLVPKYGRSPCSVAQRSPGTSLVVFDTEGSGYLLLLASRGLSLPRCQDTQLASTQPLHSRRRRRRPNTNQKKS